VAAKWLGDNKSTMSLQSASVQAAQALFHMQQ